MTDSSESLNQNFPQTTAPFVDAEGKLTFSGLAMIRALWSRTGFAPGVSSDDLALLSVLNQGADGDATARADASDAVLASLQPPVIATDPTARSGAEGAYFTALQPSAAQYDPTEAEMFALSLLGPIFAAIQSGSLSPTGVAAGTYGDATNVGQFTVDAYGRITFAQDVAISGAGSVSYVPVSMGTEPLTFVSDGSGQPILVPYTP